MAVMSIYPMTCIGRQEKSTLSTITQLQNHSNSQLSEHTRQHLISQLTPSSLVHNIKERVTMTVENLAQVKPIVAPQASLWH